MHFNLPRVQSFSGLVDQVLDVVKHQKHEKDSEAHQVGSDPLDLFNRMPCYSDVIPGSKIFRQAVGHQPKGLTPQIVNPVSPIISFT